MLGADALALAGVVLAAIPILISAIEHRDLGSPLWNGLFFGAREKEKLINTLEEQLAIYRECCITIFSIADVQNMEILLENGLHTAWADRETRHMLESRLEDFKAFERRILQIHDAVIDLQEQAGKGQVTMAFHGRSRNKHLKNLEDSISMLSRLLEGPQRNRDINTRNHSEIVAFKTARSRRASVYNGLSPCMTCIHKGMHIARIRLNSKATIEDLDLVFAFDADLRCGVPPYNASRKWELQTGMVNITTAKPEKSPENKMLKLASQDLCEIFITAPGAEQSKTIILGLVPNSSDSLELKLTIPQPSISFVRLCDALDGKETQRIGRLPLRERLNLGSLLANAVLQHHDLPWLLEYWSSSDVVLQLSSVGGQTRIQPYFKAAFTDPTSLGRKESSGILNPTLFSLGIVLIELGYDKPLEDLLTEEERVQMADPKGGQWARNFAVQRLAKELREKLPHKEFCHAAWRCCMFQFGDIPIHAQELSNDDLFGGVYWKAAKPLMEALALEYAPKMVVI